MKAAVPCLAAGIAFLAGAGLTAQPPRPGAAKGWEFSGTTKVSATVELRPRVAGPLVRIPAKDGAVVRKGDLLAEIDPRPYRAKLGAAEAGVAAAEAKVRRAELDLKRAEEVARRGIVSPEEFKRVQAAIVAEKADLDASQVSVKAAELDLSDTKLTSPIDGRVERYHLAAGNHADSGKAVATLVAADPLHVWFDIPERIVRELRLGGADAPARATVRVGFEGDKGYPHAARLDLVEPQVSGGQVVRCRAVLPNPKGAFTAGAGAKSS